MNWETPSFLEIKMDSEINAYQDDFADIPDGKEPADQTVKIPTPLSSDRR